MVKVVAHRGFSGRFPENTVVAFEKAVRLCVDQIEFDVKCTKDGRLVVLHDRTVDRTTDGTGAVAETSFAQARALDAGSWKGPAFAGVRIPTFSEALAAIPHTVELNIHAYPDERVTRQVVAELMADSRVGSAYIAIDASQIPLARSLCPEIRLCNMKSQGRPDYLETTIALGCPVIQFFHNEVTKQLVEKAHRHGVTVNVFHANDEAEAERLMSMGVDAILTDYPDVLLGLLGRKT